MLYVAKDAKVEITKEGIISLNLSLKRTLKLSKKAEGENLITGKRQGWHQNKFSTLSVRLSNRQRVFQQPKKVKVVNANFEGEEVTIPGINKVDIHSLESVSKGIDEVKALGIKTNSENARHMHVRGIPRHVIARTLNLPLSKINSIIKHGLGLKNFGI